jgi:branched-subunit amino acid transport protein
MLKYIPTAILIAIIAGIISVIGGYSVWEWKWWAFFLPLMILYFIFRDTGR